MLQEETKPHIQYKKKIKLTSQSKPSGYKRWFTSHNVIWTQSFHI